VTLGASARSTTSFLLRSDPRVKSECEGVVVGVIPKGGDDGGRVGGCVGSGA
jgi:hypothetical protein